MDSPEQKLVAFLPWVKLSSPVTFGNVTYMPFEVGGTNKEDSLEGLATPLTKILSSYVDIIDRPRRSCVVILKSDRNPSWNLVREDFEEVQWFTSLLFLAACAQNEYFQQLRSYVNRAMFDLYWQVFTEPVEYIAATARRRDGELLMGGYKHGQVKFNIPIQADLREPILPDLGLLQALHVSLAAGSDLTRRLRAALSFFSLASTDSDAVLPEAEVILMASAFEQLLDAGSAYDLSKKFSSLFSGFGGVTVDQALGTRVGIVLDPKYALDQRKWFVHRKWIEELHNLRSHYVHGINPSSRTWGWLRLEHLVVAAFAFPLAVKLCLEREGHYTLTREDKARCIALDRLLAKTDWRDFQNSNLTVWQEQLREAHWEVTVNEAAAAFDARQHISDPQDSTP